MQWLGYVTATFVLIWVAQITTPLSVYVSIRSLVFVMVLGASVVVASHGMRALPVVCQAARRRLEPHNYAFAHQVADTGRRSFIGSGWVGVIIGAIQALHSLDIPSNLGPPLALCLLSVLYGYLLALLFWLPLERSLGEAGA